MSRSVRCWYSQTELKKNNYSADTIWETQNWKIKTGGGKKSTTVALLIWLENRYLCKLFWIKTVLLIAGLRLKLVFHIQALVPRNIVFFWNSFTMRQKTLHIVEDKFKDESMKVNTIFHDKLLNCSKKWVFCD